MVDPSQSNIRRVDILPVGTKVAVAMNGGSRVAEIVGTDYGESAPPTYELEFPDEPSIFAWDVKREQLTVLEPPRRRITLVIEELCP